MGATLGCFQTSSGAASATRKGFVIIDEKVVRKYRARFWLRVMVVITFFATVFAIVMPTVPHFLWLIGYAIALVLSIALGEANLQVQLRHAALFGRWRRFLGEPVRRFPVNETERRKVAFWAEHDVLKPRALNVSKAFDLREKLERKRDELYRRLGKLENNTDLCVPEELRSFRKMVKKARRVARRADVAYTSADKTACRLWGRYLATWDFLTKPEPDGMGILRGPDFRDPDEYRRLVTAMVEYIKNAVVV